MHLVRQGGNGTKGKWHGKSVEMRIGRVFVVGVRSYAGGQQSKDCASRSSGRQACQYDIYIGRLSKNIARRALFLAATGSCLSQRLLALGSIYENIV